MKKEKENSLKNLVVVRTPPLELLQIGGGGGYSTLLILSLIDSLFLIQKVMIWMLRKTIIVVMKLQF